MFRRSVSKANMEEPQQIPSSSDAGQNSSRQIAPNPPFNDSPEPAFQFHRIFIGDDGLRSGWRFAIYIAAFLALAQVLSVVVRRLVPSSVVQTSPLWGFLIGECISLVAAIAPAFVLSRFEQRPFGAYGLPRQGAFGERFWVGVVWGIASFTLLILVMRGLGIFSFGVLALHGVHLVKFAVFWAVLFLVVGFFEEFLTRGYTLFTLSQGIGFWPAAVLLSLVFGGSHLQNKGEAYIGAAGAAAIGLFFCLTLRRTGSLWFAVGMHMSWDWSETYLYSVPDSGLVLPGHLLNSSFHGSVWLTGGSVGPEGSILLFVLIGLMALVFDRMTRRDSLHLLVRQQCKRESASSAIECDHRLITAGQRDRTGVQEHTLRVRRGDDHVV